MKSSLPSSLIVTSSSCSLAEDVEAIESPCTAVQPQATTQATTHPGWRTELKIFGSTFVTIFLAELGDKTQMTTLLMSAQSHAPWTVFLGAGTALVLTSLLGVWVGCWLSKRVSPKTLETGAGVMLLLIASWLIWDVIQG